MRVITKKTETFEIDYQSQLLDSVFIDTKADIEPINCDWLTLFSKNNLITFINDAKSTLLLSVDSLKDKQIITALQEKADDGLRIFLCLGDKKNNVAAIDHLHSRCLLRTGAQQHGALIIRDHNTFQKSGCIVANAFSDPSYQIALTNRQVDDSYRSFCKLFWEKCTEEFCGGNIKGKKAQAIKSQIVTSHNYQIHDGLSSYFENGNDKFSELICSDDAVYGQFSPEINSATKIIVSDNLTGLIEQAVQQHSDVSLSSDNLLNLVRLGGISWFLPYSFKKKYSNWALQLNQNQAEDISQWLSDNIARAKWQFHKSITIGEIEGKTIRLVNDNTDKHISFDCKSKRKVSLSPVYTRSFEEFYDVVIEELTKDNISWDKTRLATKIAYTIDRHPPYCPEKAKKDELHAEWDKAQINWVNIINEQQAKLDNLKQRQEEASKDNLRRFLGQFILGQKQSHKELKQQLEGMKQWQIKSATPSERSEKQKALLNIINEISNNTKRTENKIHESKVKYKWESKKSELEQELELAEKQYDEFKNKSESKKINLTKQLAKLNPSVQEEVTELKNNLESALRDKLPSDSNIDSLRTFFKNKKIQNKYKAIFKIYDNAIKKERTLKSQLQEQETLLLKSEKELKIKRQQLVEHSSTPPNESTQNDHLSEQLGLKEEKIVFKFPDDVLPENNLQLVRHGKKRYLIILEKKQLKAATIDAKRLNATLCTQKNED